jgi:hypothetical protein
MLQAFEFPVPMESARDAQALPLKGKTKWNWIEHSNSQWFPLGMSWFPRVNLVPCMSNMKTCPQFQ